MSAPAGGGQEACARTANVATSARQRSDSARRKGGRRTRGGYHGHLRRWPATTARSVLAEQILNARLERRGDLVERRDRRARFGSFDLREKRHAEVRAPRHLLQREVLLLTEIADGVADDLVELLL